MWFHFPTQTDLGDGTEFTKKLCADLEIKVQL